ncbi:MAG TPA: DUF3093 family protein [Solirubrobacteraceae bacterium]|nr:DUF3093 family protein [Solirubrobacteraceae bacterium]
MPPTDPIRSPTSSRRWAGTAWRRPSARRASSGTTESAGAVLGATHPLTRAIDAVGRLGRQWWISAAIVAGALIAELERHPWAVTVAVSGGLVLLALTLVILASRQRVRDEAIELIADGRETLPIAAVERQRQRLLSRRTRNAMARTLETMLHQALRPPRIMTRGARPLFSARVIASVAPDLLAVISLLQTEQTRARGVAMTERLLAHGDSPLYDREPNGLLEELHRIGKALEARVQ